MTDTTPLRRLAFPVALVTVVLSGALMLALQRGMLLGAAFSGGVTSAILLVVARAIRDLLPRISAMLVGAAVVPAVVLALMSPGAGAIGVAVAATGLALWVWRPARRTLTAGSVDPTP